MTAWPLWKVWLLQLGIHVAWGMLRGEWGKDLLLRRILAGPAIATGFISVTTSIIGNHTL